MSVLNWRTDPIYFDSEPLSVNTWLNANELIEAGKKELILQGPTLQFNLYPILVRRVDFVRTKPSDRILARFPFVNITKEEQDLILDKQLLISEKLRDYFYQSDNRSILEWRDVLRKQLERGFVPLPFLRCFSDFVTIDLLVNREFQSARGESFIMPTTLTEDLAYLCGIVNGDGSLKKYILSIVDYSTENIKQLQKQFWEFFGQKGRIQFQSENWPEIIITNLWVIRFFSFLTSQPIGGKKYSALREPLILLDEPLRSYYWSGVMDADGSYKNGSAILVSASKKFVGDFISFLRQNKIFARLKTRKDNTFHVYIPHKYNVYLKSLMVCLHPEKIKQFNSLDKYGSRTEKYFIGYKKETLINNNFNFNFNYLPNLSIKGLQKYFFNLRGVNSRNAFADKINIHPSTLKRIEEGLQGIKIKDLQRVLILEKIPLMIFLKQKNKYIRFYKKNSKDVKLDLQPNIELSFLSKHMAFYKNRIKIINPKIEIIEKMERHFDINISNNIIKNRIIQDFYSTFCIFSINNINIENEDKSF